MQQTLDMRITEHWKQNQHHRLQIAIHWSQRTRIYTVFASTQPLDQHCVTAALCEPFPTILQHSGEFIVPVSEIFIVLAPDACHPQYHHPDYQQKYHQKYQQIWSPVPKPLRE